MTRTAQISEAMAMPASAPPPPSSVVANSSNMRISLTRTATVRQTTSDRYVML